MLLLKVPTIKVVVVLDLKSETVITDTFKTQESAEAWYLGPGSFQPICKAVLLSREHFRKSGDTSPLLPAAAREMVISVLSSSHSLPLV